MFKVHSMRTMIAAVAASLILAGSTANAQFGNVGGGGGQGLTTGNAGQTAGTDGTTTPAGDPAAATAPLAIGLDAETVFSGGVDRSGGLGAAAGTVGVSPDAGNGSRSPLGGANGAFRGGGFGGLGGLGALFGGLGGQQNNTPPPLRTRLRSAVSGPSLSPVQTQNAAAMNLGRASNLRLADPRSRSGSRFSGVAVGVQDRTATINGRVGSAADRRMAELLMRLEPGVSRVQNNLQVSP